MKAPNIGEETMNLKEPCTESSRINLLFLSKEWVSYQTKMTHFAKRFANLLIKTEKFLTMRTSWPSWATKSSGWMKSWQNTRKICYRTLKNKRDLCHSKTMIWEERWLSYQRSIKATRSCLWSTRLRFNKISSIIGNFRNMRPEWLMFQVKSKG